MEQAMALRITVTTIAIVMTAAMIIMTREAAAVTFPARPASPSAWPRRASGFGAACRAGPPLRTAGTGMMAPSFTAAASVGRSGPDSGLGTSSGAASLTLEAIRRQLGCDGRPAAKLGGRREQQQQQQLLGQQQQLEQRPLLAQELLLRS